MFRYDPWQNPLGRREPTLRPDFAVLSGGKLLAVLDAKYRDLWETRLPRDMLYQLAIYALSKDTGKPRSTILYPTLAANSVDQVVLLKDPILGHKRAEVVLRPVNLLQMEGLIRAQQSILVVRKKQQFARDLVFGRNEDFFTNALKNVSPVEV